VLPDRQPIDAMHPEGTFVDDVIVHRLAKTIFSW